MAYTETTLQYATGLTVTEILATNVDSLADKSVRHSLFNKSAVLNSASTPPVTKVAAFQQALTAGAATIDLTALLGTNGATVDGTGLKVQAVKFSNPSTNANLITVSVGAADGYELAGAAFSVALQPGQEIVLYGNDATPDIAAGDKDIDLAGTLAQVLDVIIVMG